MATRLLRFGAAWLLLMRAVGSFGGTPRDLLVGVAGHAFDHLGAIGDQAEAAVASGANIIYVTGLGGIGYTGFPPSAAFAVQRQAAGDYLREAKRRGIRLAIGYVCATSIVKLDAFDKNWPPELRARLHSPPAEWRQQDRDGKPLPSWYGGDYQPACMNNPDWRTYERFMVRQQLECGCDGIFFDNPTVHPQGCYCRFCMEKFAQFLRREGLPAAGGTGAGCLGALRDVAQKQPAAFLRFRCTIGREFLADMRRYARSVKRGALVTANNSLNSAEVLYSQCRGYGYNIYELSQAEDLVVVEDMGSQPRTRADGRLEEYGPTYKQLHAISHGKPVVAVTVADADYHTPPNLVRLAQAEAAANDASYLSWPTWPEKERQRMASLIRPQAELLRRNAGLIEKSRARREVVLFLPFRNWLTTADCRASRMAADLSRANLQFEVICEDGLRAPTRLRGPGGTFSMEAAPTLPEALRGARLLLAPAQADFTRREREVLAAFTRAGGSTLTAEKTDWLSQVQAAVGEPAVVLEGPPSVRAVVRDQAHRTVVHLLNLNVQRLSSFEDKVSPVANLGLRLRVPISKVRSVRALTADGRGTSGPLPFAVTSKGGENLVRLALPRLEIAAMLVVE
jgi:hypothetical protein